ncbi:MAG: hypothetical protein EOO93_03665 [Pedobacter sp.]|nr:MAG: hypothetical protein EOO93_03665 [Pedobacter sp.]
MVDKFIDLGFKAFGQFQFNKNELSFERLHEEYNPSDVIWIVATEIETLYIGKTIGAINTVLKDMLKANQNRATRNRINTLVEEYTKKNRVCFLVGDANEHSKTDLIKRYKPVGNINGK